MLLTLFLACSADPNAVPADTADGDNSSPTNLPLPIRAAPWATDGQHLVVPNQGGFELFERAGDGWALVGRWHEVGDLADVAVHDDLVVATNTHDGVFVVSIQDPTSPTTLAQVEWPGQHPGQIWLDDGRAMLQSSDDTRFGILDLVDPSAPTWSVDAGARYPLASSLNESACFLDGHAYALSGNEGNTELLSVAPGADEVVFHRLQAEPLGTVRGLACHDGRLLGVFWHVEGSLPNVQDRATMLVWFEPQPGGIAVEVDRAEHRHLGSQSDMHLLRAQGDWLVAEPGNWDRNEGIAVFALDSLAWQGTVANYGTLLPDATRSPDAFWVEDGAIWFVGDDAVQRLGPDLTWLDPMPLPAPE